MNFVTKRALYIAHFVSSTELRDYLETENWGGALKFTILQCVYMPDQRFSKCTLMMRRLSKKHSLTRI